MCHVPIANRMIATNMQWDAMSNTSKKFWIETNNTYFQHRQSIRFQSIRANQIETTNEYELN
jgi:hypothetical protein